MSIDRTAWTLRFGDGARRQVDARPDVGDRRDFVYLPTLAPLRPTIDARESDWWKDGGRIRDQKSDPSCTGHALASIVDHLYARDVQLGNPGAPVPNAPHFSARMLYSVGRFHDEWRGERYRGSSIRGVLKGFYYNGVCTLEAVQSLLEKNGRAADDPWLGWHVTREILESAQAVQLGAYFRVRRRLADLQAALNEAALVLTSADIHDGWEADGGTIAFSPGTTVKRGRHAFVIVGYRRDGLLVQSSWGRSWGDGGVALWRYEDWAANVLDQWVLRLGAPIETRFGRRSPQLATNRHVGGGDATAAFRPERVEPGPNRLDVLGHLVPLSRGVVDRHGRYHVDEQTLAETARVVRHGRTDDGTDYRYRHLLIHFMGIQAREEEAVSAICNALPVYRENGVYPIFVMMESALSEAIHALCNDVVQEANEIVGTDRSSEKDERIEGKLSLVALRLVEQIERCAFDTFRVVSVDGDRCRVEEGAGARILRQTFLAQAARHREGTLSYHLSAHGFGAAMVAALFDNAQRFDTHPIISTLTLFAPMLRESTFVERIVPFLVHASEGRVNRRCRREHLLVESLRLVVLNEAAHRGDRPFPGYGGSWPQLWSHCFAVAAPRAEWVAGNIRRATPSPYDDERDALRLLALPGIAHDAGSRIGHEAGLELAVISSEDRNPAEGEISLSEPRHRDLDMRIAMLDSQLRAILGRPGSPTFAGYYPDRNSLFEA